MVLDKDQSLSEANFNAWIGNVHHGNVSVHYLAESHWIKANKTEKCGGACFCFLCSLLFFYNFDELRDDIYIMDWEMSE